ncbi:MAG: MATE family efflux transporter, partial [Acutalibacteraceae bacterium]
MEENNQSFLAQENTGKLMAKYAVPCIISLLVGALYNIVDQIFIANADYLGSYGNAANTVVFPLTVIALAVAVMIGDGCCAFVSLSLGKNKPGDADRSMGNSVLTAVIASIIITAIYLIFSSQIIDIFGGTVNEETYRNSKEYFFWISLGIPFYMFGQAMNPVIRADGSPKFAMISTLAGAVINIILDPIFIFVFKWGMMGAAVATVLGQIVTAVLAVLYLCRTKTVKLTKDSFKLKPDIIRRTLSLGICSFLSQISLVAAMAAINNMIRKYSASDPVFSQEQYAQIPMAVVGIVMKFFQIVISIVVGMAAGCIPIVGFNKGAGLNSRVKELFTKLLIAEACVGAVA